jgi:hypothetical protein
MAAGTMARPTGVAGDPSGPAEFLMRSRLLFRLCVPALLLVPSACGPARNAFAPACPNARLIPALADLSRFAGTGPAHDLTDLILQARVTAVNGQCTAGDDQSIVPATVQVSISVQRGPAMQGREADIPVFLAVTEGDTVLDKRDFPVHIVFPPNVDRLVATSRDIDLNLPVSPEKSAAAYGIVAGFQLTPDELSANRQGGGR